jgi:hypothetical protein
MKEKQIIEDILSGRDYTDGHRAAAIRIGIEKAAERKVAFPGAAAVGGILKATPFMLLAPPVIAAMAGNATGRAHHQLEIAVSKRRNKDLVTTRERLRALVDVAESRGGFALPEETSKPRKAVAQPTEEEVPERKIPRQTKSDHMSELLD